MSAGRCVIKHGRWHFAALWWVFLWRAIRTL